MFPTHGTDPATIPVSVLRGGTSRGVFFRTSDLPPRREQVERLLLDVLGSPDARQINGLGGATSATSKVAIVGPSTDPDADVDYTFAQVDVTRPIVDWGGNCGNILSAVGPYAIDTGLVEAVEPVATVRIRNVNTGSVIWAHVPVLEQRAAVAGDYAISGVPGTGARITLDFQAPGGSTTGTLLPTGSVIDRVNLPGGGHLDVSLVDAGNPVVFARAADLGSPPAPSPFDMEAQPGLIESMQYLRGVGAVWMGLVDEPEMAWTVSPALPKVALVAPWDSPLPAGADAAVVARVLSMGRPHPAFGVTHMIATGAAARVPGTVVAEAAAVPSRSWGTFTLAVGHPAGVMQVSVTSATREDGHVEILSAGIGRTARFILEGSARLLPATAQELEEGTPGSVAGAP